MGGLDIRVILSVILLSENLKIKGCFQMCLVQTFCKFITFSHDEISKNYRRNSLVKIGSHT